MPAFSPAIAARVEPNCAQWSRPIEVTMLSSGVRMLVLSRRPPRPTSITATSTCSRTNQSKARPVVISKKDSSSRSKAVFQRSTKSKTSSRPIIRKPDASTILMRSRKSTRWGEVKSPTRRPRAASTAASIEDTEPLPLVPAMWIVFKASDGCPSSASKARI